jgi:hypothetical protein
MTAVSDLWQEWRGLATRSGEAQRRLLRAYFDATAGVATGKVKPADVASTYWQVARSASEHYVRELGSLGLAYARAVNDLNASVADQVASGLSRASGRDEPPAATVRRMPISMTGPPGGAATAKFTMANPQPGVARISFTVSEPGITFSPETLTLQPGEEREVAVTVPLPAERFEAGDTYAAIVSVHGSDPLELRLSVTVGES